MIITGKDIRTDDRSIPHPVTGEDVPVPGLQPTPISVYLTLLMSMFMHGGWMHLLGNMLFLWIFGDNVEDYLGHVRYLLFYLFTGVAASLCHVAMAYVTRHNPETLLIPSLGASGAVLMTRMINHMRDNGIRYGMQTMCEGGGTANATIVELLA